MAREPFPGSLIPPLKQDLSADICSAIVQIDQHLQYNLPAGVARNLIACRRELQQAQSSVAAAITIAEMEGFN